MAAVLVTAVAVLGGDAKIAASGAADSAGNKLLLDAAAALRRYPGLETKLRQRVDLCGVQLIGTGVYRQLGQGLEMPLRLELKLQSGERVSTLLQVCDGRYLWTHTDADNQRQLTRVDIARVKSAWEQRPNDAGGGQIPGPTGGVGMLGGLPALVNNLSTAFRFDAVEERTIQGAAVYVLQGAWQRDKLAYLLPDQRETILAGGNASLQKLPPHLPHQVVVALTKRDLFPYHVEFQRPPTREERRADTSLAEVPLKTIVSIELFDPRVVDKFPSHLFQYEPAAVEVIDVTSRFTR